MVDGAQAGRMVYVKAFSTGENLKNLSVGQ